MDVWMGTTPIKQKRILIFIFKNNLYNIKKWICGIEQGKSGYKHIQWRCESGDDEFFDHMREALSVRSEETNWERDYTTHIEKADKWCDYEEKEGHYFGSEDRYDTLLQRFGKLRYNQKLVIKALKSTNDRQVVCWYDPRGCAGKSWLVGALWERKLAYTTSTDKPEMIMKDIASDFIQHGFRPYVIIDLPRTAKWSDEMYEIIERIKDGLVKDPRYSSTTVNIRGVKVLVCTNSKPKLTNLSIDRWVMRAGDGTPLS